VGDFNCIGLKFLLLMQREVFFSDFFFNYFLSAGMQSLKLKIFSSIY